MLIYRAPLTQIPVWSFITQDASTQAAIALFLRCLNSTTVTAALEVTNEVHARNLRAINFLRQYGDCSGSTKHNMKEICAIKDLPNAPYFPAPGFGTNSADSAFQNSNEFCFCPIPEEFLGASSGCTKEYVMRNGRGHDMNTVRTRSLIHSLARPISPLCTQSYLAKHKYKFEFLLCFQNIHEIAFRLANHKT